MGGRFGRNQKRRMRETIASQQTQLDELDRKIRNQSAAMRDARHRAFNDFVANADLYKLVSERMATEIGKALGAELAKQINALGVMQRKPVLSLDWNCSLQVDVVSIYIPQMEIRHAVYPDQYTKMGGN